MHVYVHVHPTPSRPIRQDHPRMVKGTVSQVIIAQNSKAIVILSFTKESSAKSCGSQCSER
jgi:hypothetical protein